MQTIVVLGLVGLAGGVAWADDGPPPPATSSAPGDGFMFGPLVAPLGVLDVHGGVPILIARGTDAMGNSRSANIEAVSVGASYGLIPKLEIGGDVASNIHPTNANDIRLELHGAFEILPVTDALSLGVAGAIGIVNSRGPDGMGGTSSTTDFDLQLGAWLRYAITRQLAVFTGRTPGPYALAGFSSLVLPPIRQQLVIGLSSGAPVTLDLPVALWFQASPQLALGLSTDIARFGISNSNNSFLFKDGIPVALSANVEANPHLLVGLDFIDGFKHAGDFFAFVIRVGFHIP